MAAAIPAPTVSRVRVVVTMFNKHKVERAVEVAIEAQADNTSRV
jgi:hypothetical protein